MVTVMKKRFQLVLVMLMVVAMVLGLAACGSTGTEAASSNGTMPAASSGTSAGSTPADEELEPYVIGNFMPLTGNNSTWTFMLARGHDMAIDEINANGGFNGHPVKLIRYDTTSSNEEAAKIAVRLVEDDKVDACISSQSSNEIKAAAPALDAGKVPTIVSGTSATLLSDADWDYVWRVSLNTDFTMSAWDAAFDEMGVKSVAIIYSQEDVCVAVNQAMQNLCKQKGIDVVDVESVDAADADFTAPLTNIVAAKPDIVCCYVLESANTTNQLRQLGYDGVIIQRELVSGVDYEIAGENANGWAFPSLYVTYNSIDECDIPYMRSFLEKYVAIYGELPNYEFPYRGYDAVMTLWEASKIAGSNDKEAINEALGKVVCQGLGGTIDLTHSHEAYESFGSFVFDDNRYQELNAWLASGGYEKYRQN